jgi:hypothetical protein
MIWAKIVNNEIMQTYDENPAGLWHPDQIAKNDLPGYWEEVPDHVNVGWKFKNNEWISGGQWLDEWIAENPVAPPGPPSITISATLDENSETGVVALVIDTTLAGEYTSWSVTVDGVEYSADTVELANKGLMDFVLTYNQTSEPQTVAVSGTVIGPGGTVTTTLEGDNAVVISEKFVPFFLRK